MNRLSSVSKKSGAEHDDETVLIALERLLENAGYDTTTAWGGAQALELLHRRTFDLVLLDDYLPDVGLLQFLNRFPSMHPGTRFIIMRPIVPGPSEVQHACAVGGVWFGLQTVAPGNRQRDQGLSAQPDAGRFSSWRYPRASVG